MHEKVLVVDAPHILKELKDICQSMPIMAIGWEKRV